ncbi:ribose-phosphate pyrophosphokinase [Parvularcula sp. LCG005]|uniref:ribose-phosphate pyrophosphokinase n=1 Tax=Parvularcula sp. LCG005 TaxID=3078805 RepID=UPI002942C48A|nr:ribose-phosphate pyrophosphokinase [Parvularcula sp. LCG005]WOI54628.1 ribose-phosphate pyrophosphokinase [Parvularcula sp. LCG005]
MKLLAGNANQDLAAAIAKRLDTHVANAMVHRFSDSEVRVEINENVRGEDVFVIQSTSCPANETLMELLIMIDALSRASASRITAVIPYFGYARQDRKVGPRTPITAKLVANLITTAGADRVLTIDLHAGQVQGFFDIPTDNLYAVKEMEKHIRAAHAGQMDKILVVSPDTGGVVRARSLSKRLENSDLAIVDKRRPEPGKAEVMNIIGNVAGRHCILFDDIVDSGGTLVQAATALKKEGATSVSAYVTHAVLSGDAVARIENAEDLDRLVVTDTIGNLDQRVGAKRIETVSVDRLIGEAIRRIANEESISSLFD